LCRTFLFNAISNGEKQIKAIAIWATTPEIFPCGACCQVILEVAKKTDIIINADLRWEKSKLGGKSEGEYRNKDVKWDKGYIVKGDRAWARRVQSIRDVKQYAKGIVYSIRQWRNGIRE
jgi:hypothetical protein